MSHPPETATPEPPRAALSRLLLAPVVTQALAVVARLGVADRLADGPQAIAALATATGSDAAALGRVLRTLAGVGVFAEVAPGCFGLTPIADCLREDHPDSARPVALLYGEEYARALAELGWSVRTGEPAFARVFGAPFWSYLAAHPAIGARFDRNMSGRFAARNAAVVAAYDFAPLTRLVDVGGGEGGQLGAVLAEHPALGGVLFDLPPVIARARRRPQVAKLDGRLELVAGDFFVGVPAGADGYLLAAILHDWDDEQAAAILRNVRRAIAPGGRLLLVEDVLPPGNEPSPARLLDLLMLVLLGGRERTTEEFRALLTGADFALTRIVPTALG